MTEKPTIIEQPEWDHILCMNERFPGMAESFRAAAAVPETERFRWARQRLKTLFRTGFLARGVPEHLCETIHDHIADLHALSRSFGRLALPRAADRRKAAAMISVHDIPEAIITDFHRYAPITPVEKLALERTALKIIFAHDPHAIAPLFEEFEESATPVAHWVRDLDYLQCVGRALSYQHELPETRASLEEYWDNARERKRNTAQGRAMLNALLEKKEKLLAPRPPAGL